MVSIENMYNAIWDSNYHYRSSASDPQSFTITALIAYQSIIILHFFGFRVSYNLKQKYLPHRQTNFFGGSSGDLLQDQVDPIFEKKIINCKTTLKSIY